MSNTAEFIRLVAKFDGDACSSSVKTSLRFAAAPTASGKFVDTSVSGNAAQGSAETSMAKEQAARRMANSVSVDFIVNSPIQL